MATTRFTLFPKLPAELQLQIWELAAGPGPAIFVMATSIWEPKPGPVVEKFDGPGFSSLALQCRLSSVAVRLYHQLAMSRQTRLDHCVRSAEIRLV